MNFPLKAEPSVLLGAMPANGRFGRVETLAERFPGAPRVVSNGNGVPPPSFCGNCRTVNLESICLKCNRILSDDPSLVDLYMEEPRLPDGGVLLYGTCFAHWGDVIAGLSIAQWTLAQLGQKQCAIVYAGPDEAIPEFIRAQSFVSEVRAVIAKGPPYLKFYRRACHEDTQPEDWLPELSRLAEGADLPPASDIHVTHHTVRRNYRVHPLTGAKLPEEAVRTAVRLLHRCPPTVHKRILLHPISTWSAKPAEHWPHWATAITWLLNETPHTYLLTGLEQLEGGLMEHPRLIDLVGQTGTMSEVYALASLCDSTVTTCNGVSLWTAIGDKPALVMGNAAILSAANYFRRFIDRPPNVYLPLMATFGDFKRLAGRQEWLFDA